MFNPLPRPPPSLTHHGARTCLGAVVAFKNCDRIYPHEELSLFVCSAHHVTCAAKVKQERQWNKNNTLVLTNHKKQTWKYPNLQKPTENKTKSRAHRRCYDRRGDSPPRHPWTFTLVHGNQLICFSPPTSQAVVTSAVSLCLFQLRLQRCAGKPPTSATISS